MQQQVAYNTISSNTRNMSSKTWLMVQDMFDPGALFGAEALWWLVTDTCDPQRNRPPVKI